MQHGLTLLAEQSIYAQLAIERRKPSITKQQNKNSEFYKTYSPKDKQSQDLADEYCITNLPNTIVTLPVNSIFDYILYIANDAPDYKLVAVDGTNASQTNTCTNPNTQVFNPNDIIEFSNTAAKVISNNKPLFADVVPKKPPEVVATETVTSSPCNNSKQDSDAAYEDVFGNPTTIQSAEISPELIQSVQMLIESTSTVPEDQFYNAEAINLVLNAMKIDSALMVAVNDGTAPANYDSVRAGVLLNITRNLGEGFIVDASSALKIGDAISEFVKKKFNRG